MRTNLLAGLVWMLGFDSAQAAEDPGRPNVVLIIADDMAWDDCGAFGNPRARTQNIDRLAREGKLNPARRACFVSPRPAEELDDSDADPHETVNLAGDPRHAEVLAGMRRALSDWGRETEDVLSEKFSPDEFDRETGDSLPNRVRPRSTKPTPGVVGVTTP